MTEKITDILINKCNIMQGDRVVAGVSGGADSVCLLLCLYEASKKICFRLEAVHVNHGIRGAEADRDENFTRGLCERLGVPFRAIKVDVPALCKAGGQSEEEAGRNARYEILKREAGEDYIAVAHNRRDQQETILLNLIRGTGLKGAGGMKMVSGQIIRPLLETSREEIEKFLKERNQDYCTDSTNLETEYTRNKLRRQLLPLLEELNAKAGEHLENFGLECLQAQEYLENKAEELLGKCRREEGRIIIGDALLTGEPELIKTKLIHRVLCLVAKKSKDISRVHVEAVLNLFDGKTGAQVSLPYEITARRLYGAVAVETASNGFDDGLFEHLNEELHDSEIINNKKDLIIPENPYTKWFDYDKINASLCWRKRNSGDTIALNGVGEKSLCRFMIDCKIPKSQREDFPVLAQGKEVLWVPGYRMSEKFKVTEGTKRIIIISYKEKVQ